MQVLLQNDFVAAMVVLAKTDSEPCREQVARVLLASVADTKNRGIVIQQGGVKALLPLARENTDKGDLAALRPRRLSVLSSALSLLISPTTYSSSGDLAAASDVPPYHLSCTMYSLSIDFFLF